MYNTEMLLVVFAVPFNYAGRGMRICRPADV